MRKEGRPALERPGEAGSSLLRRATEQWLGRARRFVAGWRRAGERGLHPLRRREAERLARRVRGGVLVVCQGNICRSPYAASVLAKHLEGDGVRVRSAGLIGPGRPAPRQAQQVAASRGIDLSGHRSQLLSREVAEAAGLVVVMSREQRASFRSRYGELRPVLILGDLDPGKIESRQIPDPINRDHAYYARVYDRIDRCTARLAELLSGRRSSEAPSLANR